MLANPWPAFTVLRILYDRYLSGERKVTVRELASETGRPPEEVVRILRDLDLGGHIDVSRADGGGIIRVGINAHGRAQLEQLERNEVWLLRNAILGWFAERYYSDPHGIYKTEDAGSDLGIPVDKLIPHVKYLDEKGYLECFWTHGSVHTSARITSGGLDVWENPHAARQEGFIRVENAVVAGTITGAPIQIGTQGSVQVAGNVRIDIAETTQAIKDVRSLLEDVQLDTAVYEDIEAQLQTAEAQLKSSQPKPEWIAGALRRAADLLQSAAGGAAGAMAHKIVERLLG